MSHDSETVLAVVAHPDDEILGVGGTLSRHAETDEVHVCILSDGVTARYEERTKKAENEIQRRRERARSACDHLGVKSVHIHEFRDQHFDAVPLLELIQTVEAKIDQINPSVVYTHHYGDLNIDHELTCKAVQTATRPLRDSSVKRVLAFETLSATEWSLPEPSNAFSPTVFVNIADHMEAKLDAITKYESELGEPPHPRTTKTIRQNAHVWGAKTGVEAAEPFELLREVQC